MAVALGRRDVRTGQVRGRYLRENFAQGGFDLVQVVPELVTNADAAIAAAGHERGRIELGFGAPDPDFVADWRRELRRLGVRGHGRASTRSRPPVQSRTWSWTTSVRSPCCATPTWSRGPSVTAPSRSSPATATRPTTSWARSPSGCRFRLAQIAHALPDISQATIRNALETLKTEGLVEVGRGRSAVWRRLDPPGQEQ